MDNPVLRDNNNPWSQSLMNSYNALWAAIDKARLFIEQNDGDLSKEFKDRITGNIAVITSTVEDICTSSVEGRSDEISASMRTNATQLFYAFNSAAAYMEQYRMNIPELILQQLMVMSKSLMTGLIDLVAGEDDGKITMKGGIVEALVMLKADKKRGHFTKFRKTISVLEQVLKDLRAGTINAEKESFPDAHPKK